jgi:two-component system OmpR family sensor kinase
VTTSEYSPSEYTPPPPTTPPADPRPAQPPWEEPPAAAPQRFRRLGPRSLISKLTIGVVSLVVVLVVIISAATYYSLRSFLDQRLDQQVTSTAAQNVNFFSRCLSNPSPTEPNTYLCPFSAVTREEWIGAVLPGTRDFVVFSSANNDDVRKLELSGDEQQRLIDGDTGLFTARVDDQELRVKGERGPNGLFVATGLSTDEVARTLRQLVLLEIVIGGAAVILALLATTAGVRYSLRRLRRVTTTAEDVAKELSPEGAGLDRRVPDDEPETEVGQLATSFNTMLAAVETQFRARVESEQRMRQFLADASHELRTPLTSIRGYAELTRMQRAAGDNSDDHLGRIEFEGTRMSRLVEDLLMLARGDGNSGDRPQERELIEVSGLIDDAVSGARAAFPAREFVVEDVAADAYVVGDPDQLLRVVRNLVTNAAVHTAEDRPIRIRGLEDDDGVAIQVVDGGPGLPPEEAAHVFERFWRADKARTRARGGSGLGMSIVASIVRAHGGTVTFDSTVEHGSTVTVRLPGVQQG